MTRDNPICNSTNKGAKLFNQLHDEFDHTTTEKEMKKRVKNTSLEYVGSGANRAVFIDTDGKYLSHGDACVVKIAMWDVPTQNKSEVMNYQNLPEVITKYLVPVTDWDNQYRWIVMPYINGEATKQDIFELHKHFLENGYKVNDVNLDNVVKPDDKAILLDYGGDIEEVDFSIMTLEERLNLKKWGLGLK